MSRRWIPLALIAALFLGCEKRNTPQQSVGGNPSVEKARRLLAEAGYPEGKGFPKVELLYNTSEAHKKIAAAVQNMWKRNLGIQVELVNSEWKTYLDQLSQLDYQVARRGWIGDYNDPNTFLEMFIGNSGNNNTGWKNKAFDDLIHQANAEQDPAKRRAMLEEAEQLLLNDAAIMPVYFYVNQELLKPTVQGWYLNLQGIHPVNEVHRSDGQMLVIHNGAEIQTLDPGIARGVPEHRVQIAIYEGLLNYDPKTTKPIPGVAKKWEVSEDGKTYTFHLRDAKWNDGKPVTAHDFAYAWKRVLAPATASDYAHQLYYIKGAEAYNTGKAKDGVAVTAKDDRTLVVELEHPVAFFIDLMPFFTYYPVRKDLIEKHGNKWTLPGNLVTNGPFKIKEWVTNQHVIVEKSPTYWNAAKVKQAEIKYLPIEDMSTAFDLYEAGRCDILTGVPLEFVQRIKERDDFHSTVRLGTYFYSFNVTRPPFDDIRVRKAFGLAIDRTIITEKVTRGGEKPAMHFVPPVFPGFKHGEFGR